MSSVEDESNFSIMNFVKTPVKHQMENSTLEAHINVVKNYPNINIEDEDLIQDSFIKFRNEKERRYNNIKN